MRGSRIGSGAALLALCATSAAALPAAPEAGDETQSTVSARPADTLAYLGYVSGESTNPIMAVHVVDTDGSHRRRLTRGLDPDSLEWSPDGRRLVFATDDSGFGTNGAFMMNADGSALRRIRRGTVVGPRRYYLKEPVWSPDGKEILYGVLRGESGNRIGIYSMNPSGTQSRRLTRRDDYFLSWSPDRRRIAFIRILHRPNALDRPVLFSMNRDGTGQRKLFGPLGHNDQVVVSPDWRRLAVVRVRRNGSQADLYVSNLDGTQARKVARTSSQPDMSWSPDGRALAFEAVEGSGSASIWVASADGTRARRLLSRAGGPLWSPDGHKIAFFSSRGLSVMRADGTNRRFLVRWGGELRNVRWAPVPRR